MTDDWRRLARGLLGSAPRAAVAAFFATVDDDEWVRQEDVRQGTGLLQGQVHRAVAELAELKLLTVRHQGQLNWPYYQRVHSDLWGAMALVCSAMSELTDGSDGSSGDKASHAV